MRIYQVQLSSGTRTFLAESNEEFLEQWGIDKAQHKIHIPTRFKNYGFGRVQGTKLGYANTYYITIFNVEKSRLQVLIEPLETMILKINDPRYPAKYVQAMKDRLNGETLLTNLMKTIGGGHDAYASGSI